MQILPIKSHMVPDQANKADVMKLGYCTKNVLTDKHAVWAGVLSWCRTHDLFVHNLGYYSFTEFSNHPTVAILINSFNSGTHNPINIKKNDRYRFEFRFVHSSFFSQRWVWTLRMYGLIIVSASKVKNKIRHMLKFFPRSFVKILQAV